MNKRMLLGTTIAGSVMAIGLALGLPSTAAVSAKIATQKGMLTLYSGQKFTGDMLEVTKDRPSISMDFTIGSVAVFEGEKWELCEKPRYSAPCIVFGGNETDMGEVMIKSARKVVAAPASYSLSGYRAPRNLAMTRHA